jgi:hypothetical protein
MKFGKRLFKISVFCPKTTDRTNIAYGAGIRTDGYRWIDFSGKCQSEPALPEEETSKGRNGDTARPLFIRRFPDSPTLGLRVSGAVLGAAFGVEEDVV